MTYEHIITVTIRTSEKLTEEETRPFVAEAAEFRKELKEDPRITGATIRFIANRSPVTGFADIDRTEGDIEELEET
jgi:hypothetical protein